MGGGREWGPLHIAHPAVVFTPCPPSPNCPFMAPTARPAASRLRASARAIRAPCLAEGEVAAKEALNGYKTLRVTTCNLCGKLLQNNKVGCPDVNGQTMDPLLPIYQRPLPPSACPCPRAPTPAKCRISAPHFPLASGLSIPNRGSSQPSPTASSSVREDAGSRGASLSPSPCAVAPAARKELKYEDDKWVWEGAEMKQ